jgi:LacI family transcriptional regulator
MTDVAKAAAVSTMTVSRVLNQNPHVTEGTRRLVLDVVEKLHYQRNELARSLREQRTRQIGILIPNLCDPFFANCAHAVSVVAKDHGYTVVIATSNEDPDDEFAEARRMVNRHVEGIVVIPAGRSRTRLLSPDLANMPLVALDRPLDRDHCDSVLVQNKRGGQIATEHLISLGHKRILCISLGSHLYTIRMRQQGYRDAMRKAGLDPEVHTVTDAAESTDAVIRRLVDSNQPPTALFCTNNLVTRHVLHALQSLNLYPPKAIALVGFDDFETADLLQPGVTVVRQLAELMGSTAAEALFARLEQPNHDGPSKRIVLPVELVVRGSCGGKQSKPVSVPKRALKSFACD